MHMCVFMYRFCYAKVRVALYRLVSCKTGVMQVLLGEHLAEVVALCKYRVEGAVEVIAIADETRYFL